jgi:hypothetical protein
LLLELPSDLRIDHLDEVAGDVGVQYFGMHVTLATDGRSVAKLLRHLLDGGDDVALGFGLAVVLLELRQCEGCKDRSCPSPEILGAEILLSSRMYWFTSPESTVRDSPSPSRYLKSS